MAYDSSNIFEYQMEPRNVTQYMLTRGVADYSNLYQWNNYETGYAFLFLLKIPTFLEKLASQSNSKYATLINNYRHILEYDFRSLDGLENMTGETNTLEDGINSLQVITKVTEQSAGQFTLRMFERSGSVITKVNELFLRGIKDPRTQVKRYHGLLEGTNGTTDNAKMGYAGYEHETFEFMYFVTDNTCFNIEKAYLLVSCQPTVAELEMYNYSKGDIQWRELNYQFNGYPITGPAITKKAKEFLDWVNSQTIFEETKFGYKALGEIGDPNNHGGRRDHPHSWSVEESLDGKPKY